MNLSRRIQTQGSILDIVDPILTSQAMLASTKIGMWKRNGAPVEGQQYIYHSPHLGVYQKKNSLLLMQESRLAHSKVANKMYNNATI